MRDVRLKDVVLYELAGEDVWCKVLGDHNNGGLQAQVVTPLDCAAFELGDMVRLEREKIKKILSIENGEE